MVPTRTSERWSTGVEALRRGLVLTGLAVWEALLWLCACVCLVVVYVGVSLLPPALDAVRSEARRQRRFAWDYSHLRVTENYAPDPVIPSGRYVEVRRQYARAYDPSSWKDLLWHVVNPIVGTVLARLPIALLLHGVFGLLMPPLWGPVVSHWDNSWYGFIPISSFGATLVAFGSGRSAW